MISVSFINNEPERLIASDPFMVLERAMITMSNEIDEAISGFCSEYDQYTIESEIMGEIDNDKLVYMESKKTNIFEKIGNAVISIFKKVQEIVVKFIDNIKNIGFKNKSNEEKMKSLLEYYKKNEPEKYKDIKDEVIVAIQSGDLNPVDMKSIKEMSEAYDELVKLAKQKNIKPDTLRGKFEEMKKKFDNIDQSKTVKVAKAATAVITAITAIVAFKSKILDSKKSTIEYEKKLAEKNEATIKAIRELQEYEGGEFASDSLTKAQLLKNASFWITGQYGKLISREQGAIDKFDKGITAWIARHERAKKDAFVDSIERGSRVLSDKEARSRANERTKNREDAYDKSTGTRQAQNDSILGQDSSTRKAIKKETELKTKQTERTKRYLSDEAILRNRDHQDAIKYQAELQASGRAAGTPDKKSGVQKIAIVDSKGDNIRQSKKK